MKHGFKFACGLWLMLTVVALFAHEVRPALLHLKEVSAGRYTVLWKVPAVGERVLAVRPVWPEGWRVVSRTPGLFEDRAWLTQMTLDMGDADPAGATLVIENLMATRSEVLLVLERLDGGVVRHIFRPAEPAFTLPTPQPTAVLVGDYVRLGFVHIFEGADHLLFLLALLLLVQQTVPLLKAVTAFTAAHSITLCLATLKWVSLSPPLVEALIALSVVFMAVSLKQSQDGRRDIIQARPWSASFLFGLIHGFGFAGALGEIGLPVRQLPPALLSFNLGVEAGQVLFLLVLSLGIHAACRLPSLNRLANPTRLLTVYGVGSVAAFFVIERSWALTA